METSASFSFDASHIIPDHPGKCHKLHGHRWVVTLSLQRDLYDFKSGLVMDMGSIRKLAMPIVARLDHTHLNFFMSIPTAENVALYFAHEIFPKLDACFTLQIEVSDTPTSKVILTPSERIQVLRAAGWQTQYANKILSFADMEARVRWVGRTKRQYAEALSKVNDLGAQLVEFELYAQSLDPTAAKALLNELTRVEPMPDVELEEQA